MNGLRAAWRWLTFDFIPPDLELSRQQRKAIHDLAWSNARSDLGKWARIDARLRMLVPALLAAFSALFLILMLARHRFSWLLAVVLLVSLLFMLVAAVRYREIIRNAQLQAMNSLGAPVCSACGYLLKGERREPICPECGAVILSPTTL